ncbi:hypothetical protein ACSMXM_10280 [Pacificimonas sp. ICDLI1SI03]
MIKIRTFAVLGAAFLSTVSFAQSAPGGSRINFTEEATGYEVDGHRHPSGRLCLTGQHPETGETFKLRVSSSGFVRGTFAGREVSYRMNNRETQQNALIAMRD